MARPEQSRSKQGYADTAQRLRSSEKIKNSWPAVRFINDATPGAQLRSAATPMLGGEKQGQDSPSGMSKDFVLDLGSLLTDRGRGY
jgi:hypothetical protein